MVDREDVQGRRSALAKIVIGAAAACAAGLSGLFAAVAVPKTGAAARRWRRAVSALEVPANAPLSVVLAERYSDGWMDAQKQTAIFVDRDGANGYRAFSATCTHLGCRVQWDATSDHYVCPCHGGTYDRMGRVVSGPPPRPLDALPARVNPTTGDLEVQV